MSAEQIITIAYLAVSVVSLLIQSRHLHRMRRARAAGGLTRTAACRVGCSVLYVLVGVNALAPHWAVLQFTFAAYLATAIVWWENSRLDGRLIRPKRHRRRRFITITIGRPSHEETRYEPVRD